ncbi:biotin holocarboxylase synthetase [Linnemannia hyalina]|uniref:Biotin holocarboxylase synthetase n=1 Tax=Linnemannia hyalina TaxID=64524 RepID=A0A9P7XXV8_9FUNG|nr:biotin holocarboxylase synthetase [Linnemannia hyalina]
MNILVYSGDGTSRTSLIHTVNSLRSLVGQHYDVMKIDATGLLTEPWEDSTSLLVIPGGRDLPFTRDLNGATNDRIRNYVQSGGRFFGICAGAYYGSDRISFELGRSLEVQGERELKFFAGECRGAVYPGFVYESESGANAVGIQLNQEVFSRTQQGQDAGLDFAETKVYFNGGGYFVDADKYPGTTVMAWYKKESTQIEPDSPGPKAAMVACQVGQGLAVLTGVHPEYNATHLDARNPEYGPQPNVVNRLLEREHERRLFLRSVLAKMGLSVAPPEPGQAATAVNGTTTGVIQGVPSITPLFLASVQPSYTTELSRTLLGLANGQGQIQEVNDTFQIVPSLQHTIPVHNPTTPATAPGLEQEEGEENITKNIVLCADAPPPTTMTPEFNMAHFFQHLDLTRQQQLATGIGSRFSNNNLTFGNSLLYGQVVTSTQTMLDKNFGLCQRLPNGFVCNATIQVSGRGRGRNSWISPPGCLQFSMVLRHPVQAIHASAVFVQYLVALAVVESVCSLPGYEDLPLRLKWPNDIYAEAPLDHPSQAQAATASSSPKMIKIGGVLVNSNFDGSEFLLVIALFSQETLLAQILVKFEQFHRQFLGGNGTGFAQFEEMYYRRWLHSDAIVTLTTMTPHRRVRIKGISLDYGLLRTVGVDEQGREVGGEEFRLQPDGNSFDMLKGLISQKA